MEVYIYAIKLFHILLRDTIALLSESCLTDRSLVQDQKEMQGILLDAISEQIRGMQSITKLLTQKLEKVLHSQPTFKLACLCEASCLPQTMPVSDRIETLNLRLKG